MSKKTIIKNVIPFTALVVGVPQTTLHGLMIRGAPALPQFVLPDIGGYTITVTTTTVTVTRTTGPAAVNVYLEHWHTIEALLPPGKLAGLVPFIVEP
jgi:hypothetical protein